MGKVTGFLEIDRRDRRYVPASGRIRNYKEFLIPLSVEAAKDQAARGTDCRATEETKARLDQKLVATVGI